MSLPVILLCGPEHADVLESEFARYVRDYDVRVARTAAEACDVLREVVASGGRVPMLVTESRLPDTAIHQAFHD
jgi:thioredoxin reductase (NADPH)